ncbi:MAG TPA: PD-(D/E)XK nuclease family protein [Steroidobacteraceae bacterium]|nr:PD-(D/E)XK nuclease family protein [Steroidobacteraceae bacterium]
MIRIPSDLRELILRGGTLLVPSRQRAYAARLAHAAERLRDGQRVWATPDILTREVWVVREFDRRAREGNRSAPRLLSPAEDWWLWRQCTLEQTQDQQLLNRTGLGEALRHSSALAAEFGINLTRAAAAGSEAQLLARVEDAVQRRCAALGVARVNSKSSALEGLGAGRDILAAGFLPRPPGLDALGVASRQSSRGTGAEPRVVLPADEQDEMEDIADWCRQRLGADPGARLLVFMPGSVGRRERLATLIRQTVSPGAWIASSAAERDSIDALVVIEGGLPLPEIPAIRHALESLRFLAGSAHEAFSSFSEWLRAPYWVMPGIEARARVDLWLREAGPSRFNHDLLSLLERPAAPFPASIAVDVAQLLRRVRSAHEAMPRGNASPREWSERFRAALQALGWPGSRQLDSGEQQTVVRFHELLDEFGQLAASVGPVSRGEAVQWLAALAARNAYRPADADAAVIISSAFADPVVLYDGIWVAGLNAEAFPQPVQPDPFLPYDLQRAAGIPAASADGRLAEAHSLLASWRAATDDLVLSAPRRAEDLELLPSPLLAPWLAQTTRTRGARWLADRMHRADRREFTGDEFGSVWPAARDLPGGTRSIELQNTCPFRAYAELRLGSAELGAPEPGVRADTRGRLLHAALESLWQRVGDSGKLAELSGAGLHAWIEESVNDAVQRVFGSDASGNEGQDASLDRERRRAARLIGRLCEKELARLPFRVIAREAERTVVLGGSQLTVRIDRVDEIEGGARAILDYKSGRRVSADWYGERPSHPQLLVYLAAEGERVEAIATVNLTAREVCFDGIARFSDLLPRVKVAQLPTARSAAEDAAGAWQLRRREWLALVEKLAADFIAGRATVDPKSGACRNCHAISLCRIRTQDEDPALDAENGMPYAVDE